MMTGYRALISRIESFARDSSKKDVILDLTRGEILAILRMTNGNSSKMLILEKKNRRLEATTEIKNKTLVKIIESACEI